MDVAVNTPTRKVCLHCRCDLSASEFVRGGSTCLFCKSLARKRWKLEHPERARVHRREQKRRRRAAISAGKPPRPVALKTVDPEAWRAKRSAEKRYRERAEKNARPGWADRGDIEAWYHVARVLSRGGVQFHVDHIVPLRGATVCGLHVSANLTVLPHHLNASKGNRHWPDMP